METELSVTINQEAIGDPKNYAAIYARISSQKDNNSIKAQIEKAKAVLSDSKLLVYGVYTDHVSGRTTSPPERKGFGKLLEDAKSGCFKTVIAYKHDRVVRNLGDWIQLKNQFKKLGIKIMFSDETEYCSDNSLQGEFLENLIVMVSELEPNNINERTSNGMDFRRNEGVYILRGNVPFGYELILPEDLSVEILSANKSNIKNWFRKDEIKAAFVYYAFQFYSKLIHQGVAQISTLKNDINNLINIILDNLSLGRLRILETSINDSQKSLVIRKLIKEIENPDDNKNIESIIDRIDVIRQKISETKIYFDSTGNIQTIFKSPTYGGYLLKKAKQENKGIDFETQPQRLDYDYFKGLINLPAIAEKESFERVYCHMHILELSKPVEPEYLFKRKLKCDSCSRYMHLNEGLVGCPTNNRKKACKSYSKTNLIESILDIMIDDFFKKSHGGFAKFLEIVETKISDSEKEIEKLRNDTMRILNQYILKRNGEHVDTVYKNQQHINALLEKVSEYRKELSYIIRLQKLIHCYVEGKSVKESPNELVSKIKSEIIFYIITNEEYFNSIFKEIINSIRVNIIYGENKTKCKINVDYGFSYQRDCDIFESIH